MLANILIIIACVAAVTAFLFLVSRTSTAPSRKESNDFTGAVVAVIGTTYAVILAFTLAGVWAMFQQAQANEEQEANALVNVFRIASQLKDPNAKAIQELCVRYADNALEREWPAMEKQQMPPEGEEIINQLWTLAGRESGTCAARRHRGLPAYGGVARIDPIPPHSRHAGARSPAWHSLGGPGCGRHHHGGVVVLLWSAEFPFSFVASAGAELLDRAGVGGHRGH